MERKEENFVSSHIHAPSHIIIFFLKNDERKIQAIWADYEALYYKLVHFEGVMIVVLSMLLLPSLLPLLPLLLLLYGLTFSLTS